MRVINVNYSGYIPLDHESKFEEKKPQIECKFIFG